MNSTPVTPPSRKGWSLELILVVALPASAVVAGFITLWLAMQSPVHSVAPVDRFGHSVVEHSSNADSRP
jgi:hypothetical protein